MRILHLVNSLELGGAERLISDLAPAQAARGHEVRVAALSSRGDAFGPALAARGIEVAFLGSGSVYDPRAVSRIRGLAKRADPEVVHVHLFPAQYFAAAALSGARRRPALVTTEHSTDNRRVGRAWARPLERAVYSRYDEIAAVGPAVLERYAAWLGPRARISVVANGVDLSGLGEGRAAARAAFGLPDDCFIIGFCGRMRAPKDPGTLVRALAALPDRFAAALIGEGPLRSEAEALAAELGLEGRVSFLGARGDARELLAGLDAFVVSSGYEGMPMTLIEAMAAGAPVLAADIQGCRAAAGEAALYFRPGDAGGLAALAAWVEADGERASAMAEAGRARAAAFDVRAAADSYLALYSKALGERTSCRPSR
jgi:glycosyltransferase involved in cell wall biosynthesis